ncbi:retrovirus-related pol polyprotein from transposon TNT 1-94 [Tanacetum coccineum]
MITQLIDIPSGNNTEVSRSIIESLVPDVTQSHISNQAFTSSHPVPQDRWLRDQHIELVNVIGDPGEGMLTRSMAAKLAAALASECLFADFLSKIEPKKVSEALKHLGWVDAMQEELNQFYRNKVWTLVPLLYGKIAIGSKWVFRNKKDDHGITIKNKARLVAQSYSQEEGIYYDETFTPVERMEAIRIFLAFATYMNLKVYQIDVKSAFLNGDVLLVQVYVDDIIFGSTSYKLCKQFEKLMTKKFEMSMMGELTYFLRLQIKQDDKGILIGQEPYTRNLLKKYEISNSSSVKTPMVPPNNLGPDLAGKSVNETSYRGMIGSVMYLTETRPDIQFFTVMCARYQSNPKESHLIAMKRILRYLKSTPTLGLYYPKCSGFNLKGYSDSDYVGCNMDKKGPQVPVKYLVENWFVGVPRNSSQCEFWSTVVAYDPFLSTDETEQRPLREFLIKFSVLNGQRPLTLNFNTFCSSTGLDYNNGKYVAHPTPEAVKKELGKISINLSYLDKTPVLKNSFPMAWRILFTFVIQVLGRNYSFTKQVNSIQQIFAYCLITRTEVDIREIIYSDLVTKLLNKSRLKYVSCPRFISCALQVLRGSLSKKSKRPKSKEPPTQTKVTPLKPTEGSEQSYPVSSGTIPDPQDLERNIQLTSTGCLSHSMRALELTSTTSDEGMAKTTLRPKGSLEDKDSWGNISPTDMEPINPTDADLSGINVRSFLLSDDEAQESEEDILGAGEEIDEEPRAASIVETHHQSPPPQSDKPQSSYAPHTEASDTDSLCNDILMKYDNILPLTERQLVKCLMKMSNALFAMITEDNWEKHKDVAVNYVNLKASIDDYYDENIAHRDQTDKLVEASMSSLDKSSNTISDLYKGLNIITELLKEIKKAVKDESVINKKITEAIESFTKFSTNINDLQSSVNTLQAHALKQDEELAAWAKSSTNMAWNLGS